MQSIDTQVLVVGAGPTGLTLACCLARQGIDVQVLEQAEKPSSVARGTAYQPRTLEVFDDLGVIDEALLDTWTDMPMLQYLDGEVIFDSSRIVARIHPAPEVPYPSMARPLPTWRVEQLLRDRLAELGQKVEFGTRLIHLVQEPGNVVATIQRGETGETETVRARYLVGCDGGHSTTRDLVDIEFDAMRERDFVSYLAELDVFGLEPTYARLWLGERGSIFLSPIPLTGNWQLQAEVRRDTDGNVLELDGALAQELFAERTGRQDVTFSEPTWRSVYVVRERLARRYRKENVLLAGDAAHVHSPMGGQGANTGIQDAYNLGWKLGLVARGAAPASLLDSYEAERRPIARTVLQGSGLATEIVFRPGAVGRLARWALFRVFGRQLISRATQLNIAYPESPLTFEPAGRFSRGLSSGDRAPDGRVIQPADGRRARLFDVFRGSHFTLLLFGADTFEIANAVDEKFPEDVHIYIVRGIDGPVPDAPVRALIDPHRRVARAYGARREPLAALVRPDGYLAYLGRPSGLLLHLETILSPATSALPLVVG